MSDVSYLSTTLAGLLDHRAEVTGDDIGFAVPFQGIRKTYSQFKKDVEDLASGLIALGLNPRDRLGEGRHKGSEALSQSRSKAYNITQ